MDKKIEEILRKEMERQKSNIELIASENYVSDSILKLQGSIFTNKYAEGYPSKRYYGGCENADSIENLAIQYACQLFHAKYANVQPHSGSSANMAVYRALLHYGDTIMGMDLSDGGHLTHGYAQNFSGRDYKIVTYSIDPRTGYLDYERIKEIALKERPKMIVAGASSYSRIIDFKKFREIANEINAYLLVDMAHVAGLVAANLHPNPMEYADIVTSTTHKTLRGPRGGLILTNNEEIIKKINKEVFPGIQGGPLIHVISAKAQCFYEALKPEFTLYQKQVLKNIKVLSDYLISKGVTIISNGTDNHLILIDVYKSFNLTGKEASEILEEIHITVNKNIIPNDKLKPTVTSGIRIGSPAMTTKGLKEEDFLLLGDIIYNVLSDHSNITTINKEKERVAKIIDKIKG